MPLPSLKKAHLPMAASFYPPYTRFDDFIVTRKRWNVKSAGAHFPFHAYHSKELMRNASKRRDTAENRKQYLRQAPQLSASRHRTAGTGLFFSRRMNESQSL